MIQFQSENTALPDVNLRLVRAWIQQVAASHGKKVKAIHYVFCSDAEMLDCNRKYLNHDYYTDIITFDYSQDEWISGDIYVGTDTVRSNADMLRVAFTDEWLRVVIHGILHLCGFKDKTPEEAQEMRRLEEAALQLIK
jgi:rRNA maturation RNase YbeY